MSTPAHTPTCDHCGYELAGLAPDERHPHLRICPECGQRTDIRRAPQPISQWRRFGFAILAGAATVIAMYFVGFGLMVSTSSSVFRDPRVSLVLIPALLSGVVSMSIIWRSRVAYLRWQSRPHARKSLILRFLFVDYLFFCLLNVLAVLCIGSGLAAVFR